MADLIDRQVIIDAVRKCPVKEVTPAFMLVDKAEVMAELMMLPSAQPEIVRCKDCKKFEPYKNMWQGFCNEEWRVCMIDDFCSWAERRTDEHTV